MIDIANRDQEIPASLPRLGILHLAFDTLHSVFETDASLLPGSLGDIG
jgi:hypothetical protein